jgi:hypothetical protein
MYDLIQKIKKENPEFIEKSFNIFAKKMPKLLLIMYDGEKYDNHIGSKEVAMLAKEYITNNKDELIGFHWSYDEVASAIKSFIDIEKEEFYPCDIWVWANVRYGDMAGQREEIKPIAILESAINDLKDTDYPFCPASQRAYCWLKKHIEESERD